MSKTSDALEFRRCADLYGQPVELAISSRGRQQEAQFPNAIWDPNPRIEAEDSRYSARLAKMLKPFTPAEQRTFVLIHVHQLTIADAAKVEKCRRQAIYSRIESMLRKSQYCRVSADAGRLRRKVNQHG